MSTLPPNINVLIVDDSADTRDLLRIILEESGVSVVAAESVDQAVEAFRRSPAHVVVTDIRLGRSDGYQLLEAIRNCNAEYRGFTPVVALTGYGSAEDEARAMDAGFYAYVRKPFALEDLMETITRAFR